MRHRWLAPTVVLYNYYTSWSVEERQDADRLAQVMIDGLRALGHRVETAEFWRDIRPALAPYHPLEWVVFNWCEGVEGEFAGDARVCAEMDALGYAYTGNPPEALRLSVQKDQVKALLRQHNLPTPPGRAFNHPDEITADAWDAAWFPAIVKPTGQHCSVAVTRDAVVHTLAQLRDRVAYVVQTVAEPALAERFIVGREINVGIWGNSPPQVLPLREIDFSRIPDPLHRMVTWDSKWVPSSPDWNNMPVIEYPQVSAALRERIRRVALKTYRVCGCRDYARVDLRIDAEEEVWVVDVNPNPDITHQGGFAGACYAAGYTYAEAVSRIIGMAAARLVRRRRQHTLAALASPMR